MADPVLRRAVAADAGAVADVYLTAMRTAMPWLALVHTDDQVRDWIARHVVPDLETWVAEVDGDVTAMMSLDVPAGFLAQLHVAPAHQGRGLGSALVAMAKERCPAGLQLWTFQRNEAARRFYERRGFVAAELTDGHGNEEREPDVRYAWGPAVS